MKSIEYQHENEVRVAAHCQKGMKGLMITGIRVDELIREIVISPLLPEDEAEAIERFICSRLKDRHVPVRQSKLVIRSIASGLIRSFNERSYGVNDENIDLSGLPEALKSL